MTFCVAIEVRGGIVGLSDTQIVKGPERSSKGKVEVHSIAGGSFFVMSSGLRSVRDKTLIYLKNALDETTLERQRLYEVANLLGSSLQTARHEDGDALAESSLKFNAHFLLGGQLAGDKHPTLYYVYPEGNWIESSEDIPYFVVGRTYYAKPILDRLLSYEMNLEHACALAVLAFDMTRTSVTDVDFPLDLVVIRTEATGFLQHRFTEHDMRSALAYWHKQLALSLDNFPMEWANPILGPPSVKDSQ